MSYHLRSTTRGKGMEGNPDNDPLQSPFVPASSNSTPPLLEHLHEGENPGTTSVPAEPSFPDLGGMAPLTEERPSQEEPFRQEAPRRESLPQELSSQETLRQEFPPRREAIRQEFPPQQEFPRQELPGRQEPSPQHELPPPPPRGAYPESPRVANPAGAAFTPDLMAALEDLLAWRKNLYINEPARACVGGVDHCAPAKQAPPALNIQAHPEPTLDIGRTTSASILEQVEQLINARMGHGKMKVMPALLDSASHPLHPDLARVIVPPNIVPRAIPDYFGKGDPVQHVQRHETSLLGKTVEGSYHALTFPATLGGSAATWFYKLPKGSVTSWTDLKAKFIQHYMGERQLLKGSGSLDDVKQESGESLASFYSRFNQNIADVDEELSQGETVRAFLRNLTAPYGTPLKDSSEIERIYTTEKLAERVKVYVDLENSRIRRGELPQPEKPQLNHTPKQPGASSGEQKPQNKRPPPTSGVSPWTQGGSSKERNSGYHPRAGYTALVCPISEVYKEIEDCNLLEPPPIRNGTYTLGNNLDQWCNFHKIRGHSTDDCRQLKKEIEALIRRGSLEKFVANKRPRSKSPPLQGRASTSGKEWALPPEARLPSGSGKYID